MDAKDELKMTQEDIAGIINSIEESFPVDKWVINKIHIWPIIRINLFASLSYTYVVDYAIHPNRKYFADVIHRGFRISSAFFKFIIAHLLDHKKNMKMKKCDVVFLSDGISLSKVNNYWFERFCDPLVEYFNKKDISSFVMTASNNYFIPRFNPSKFVQPFFYLYGLMSKGFSQVINAEGEQLPDFSLFCDFLELKYPDIERITLKTAREEVAKIRMVADFFKRILKKTNPKVGFVVSYYGIEGLAFDLACREFGIPAVDIQHGFEGDLHLAYCRWHKVPDSGYELLPSFFWCWSDFEVSVIKKSLGSFSRFHMPILGGNLWLSQWLNGDLCIIKSYDKIITEFKEPYKHGKHILFTQSMGIRNRYFINILEVIKNSPSTWFWWVRIHPCELKIKPELKRLLRENAISNYDIDLATRLPLYALLRHVDVHVTTLSATVLEAESFGVPSVVTHPVGNECCRKQISSGSAIAAYASEDILRAIKFQLNNVVVNEFQKIQGKQYPDILECLVSSIKQGSYFAVSAEKS